MANNWKSFEKIAKLLVGSIPETSRPDLLNRPFFPDIKMESIAQNLGKDQIVAHYLNHLNAPLAKFDLFPLFGEEIVIFSLEMGGNPYFYEVSKVLDVGDKVKMPIVKFSAISSEGKVEIKEKAFLMQTKQSFYQEGSLGSCIAPLNHSFPRNLSYGEYQIDKNTYEWLNQELQIRQRVTLPRRLTETKKHAIKVVKSEIKFFDDNSRYFTVINFGGQTLLFNRLNIHGSQGEISLARFGEGEVLLIDQLRYLVGKRERSAVRGWPKENINFLEEMARLLGIHTTGKEQIITSKLPQSRATDYVTLNTNLVVFNKDIRYKTTQSEIVISESGFESVMPVQLSDKSLWEQIQNGFIWDSYTISVIATMWFRLNLVRPTAKSQNFGLVLENRVWPSGEMGWEVPRIPFGSGIKISEIMPDSGSKRIVNPVETISVSHLPKGRNYKVWSLSSLWDGFLASEFDAPTGATILISLIREGLMELV